MKATRVIAAVSAALLLAGCGAQTPPSTEDHKGVRVAVVANPDIEQMQALSNQFSDATGIQVEFDTLREGELRQRITTDIATGAGLYDVVMVGPYETPLWAEQGWLEPFEDAADPDLIPSITEALSFDGKLYALPFYGESAFTMYRSDLFASAGLTMPKEPTWTELLKFAETLHDPGNGVYGACLRGEPGWGENVALVTAMVNAYGGRWFDENWDPQLNTEPWNEAVTMYADLAKYADPDTPNMGFNENREKFREGGCALWVDSTAAAPYLTNPESSVSNSVSFAQAPTAGGDIASHWMWTWALAVSEATPNKEAAKEFVTWATSPEYTELVAKEYGWAHVPPGTRVSLYENPEYLAAAPFAPLVFEALTTADPLKPTKEPVPYTGIQYVMVPEFQGIGTAVGNQIADVIAGNSSVDQALDNSQWVTSKVSERIRFTQEEK